jgi:hypothetical protein
MIDWLHRTTLTPLYMMRGLPLDLDGVVSIKLKPYHFAARGSSPPILVQIIWRDALLCVVRIGRNETVGEHSSGCS